LYSIRSWMEWENSECYRVDSETILHASMEACTWNITVYDILRALSASEQANEFFMVRHRFSGGKFQAERGVKGTSKGGMPPRRARGSKHSNPVPGS